MSNTTQQQKQKQKQKNPKNPIENKQRTFFFKEDIQMHEKVLNITNYEGN